MGFDFEGPARETSASGERATASRTGTAIGALALLLAFMSGHAAHGAGPVSAGPQGASTVRDAPPDLPVDSVDEAIAQIYELAKGDDAAAAKRYADRAVQRFPDSAALWEAAGYVRRGAADYTGALDAYERAARLDASASEAWRGQALMLQRLGAPAPAAELIRSHPGMESDPDLRAIESEQTALELRYADGLEDGEERRQRLQAILERLDELVGRAGGTLAAAERGESAPFDRMQAGVLLRRDAEVAAQYEAMIAASIPVPGYAQRQAAIAYEHLGASDRAIAILTPLVREQPDDLDGQFELFYALVDRDRLPQARELIDKLVRRQMEGPDREGESRARIARAMQRAYDENPSEAIGQLDSLLDAAPLNADALAARATVYYWRGWIRRARSEAQAAMALAPRNRDARALMLRTDMSLGDWPDARRRYEIDIREHALSYRDEQQIGSELQWQQRPQVLLSAAYGTGSQTAIGSNRDWQLDAQAFGAVWRERYRVFSHLRQTDTDIRPTSLARTWGGLGLEGTWPTATGSFEVAGVSGEPAPAAVLRSAWQPLDGARLGLNLASSDPDTPARASAARIRMRSGSLAAGYDFSESTGVGADAAWSAFTDGNRQQSTELHLSQRLFGCDLGKLVWINSAGIVHDSLPASQALYFDPSRAVALDTELRAQWLGARDALRQRSRWHTIDISFGRYQQSGYGSRPMGAARYEQRWALSGHSELSFGVERSFHPYDGHTESRTALFAAYEGRL